jgi:hypothetical protein
MRKETIENLIKYLPTSIFVIFFILLFVNTVHAQDATTTPEEDPAVTEYPTLKPNPYANLSQEEQDKLPISAQVPSIKEQVFVDVYPTVPKPGDVVTLSATAFGGIDINSADINWIVNGKSVLKGRGEKEFSVKVGGDGVLTTVEMRVQPQYGEEVVRTFKFNPAEVDVLWQANTYTPPFYKGKAFYTPEANVEFVAMPNITTTNGSKIQPSKAVYNWRIDYTAYGDKSGFGKNVFKFAGSILSKPTNVNVVAYDPLNNESAGVGKLDIGPTQPLLLMYEIHPTYGPMFNRAAVGTYRFGAQDIQLGAYPYFFSTTSKKNIKYAWTINNYTLEELPENQDFLTLQKLKQEAGQSTIAVTASLDEKVLQQSDTKLDLLY